MVLSASFIWIWLVITELLETPFLLSEQQSFTRETTSEDPDLTYLEKTTSNSQSQEQSQEQAIEDIDQSSKLQNQELLDNDLYTYLKLSYI